MRPINTVARARLLEEIQRTTPARAGVVAARLRVGVATLHRMMKEYGADIFGVGGSSNRRYAVRRPLRGQRAPLPVYRINEVGQGDLAGTLEMVAPRGSFLDLRAMGWPTLKDTSGWWEGLPYPIYDMRPQGFLGRNFARWVHGDLAVPESPTDWNDDDIAHVLSQRGADTIGNLIVGDRAFERFLDTVTQPFVPIAADLTVEHYAQIAQEVANLGVPGSSAGGEFPKFTACRELDSAATPHVIVKFSGAEDSATVVRWADLLTCEHLALETLREACGLSSVRSRILGGQGRTYLETERFDRHGFWGRSAVVSLDALNGALIGAAETNWPGLGLRLLEHGLIDGTLRESIDVLWWYGRLIGNTDMHLGNLSFRFQPVPGQSPRLALAPTYDMLPMFYAPLAGGEVPSRDFAPPLPLPLQRPAWGRAFHGALAFWRRAASDARISAPFRQICTTNGDRLEALGGREGVAKPGLANPHQPATPILTPQFPTGE
ncbi:MAG: type II toxin-antitoxin system HipA family toxin YjjJ [Rhodocyclaceae bacterium]|nr:type II toxin-antitoxin system HipA family toxin YjjJ [Rhodocyclaceae bacterium]